jgi:type II secretory pathway predicted ATPase ExeA
MYESFFQLNERPFAAAPRVDRYFAAASVEGARQTLARCIERAEGAGMLIGPAGSGKTLVCHVLAEQFREQFAVALLANGHLSTRRALLQAILFELGLPYRGLEEGELRLSLIDHLASDRAAPQGMLLLLDEAHTFPIRLLEEVRLITNLVRGGQPRVRLVLAGNPLLEERFANPLLDSFSQRISSRCYLEGLDRAQTEQYIAAQIAAVGATASRIFTPDALEAAYRATDGIPRLLNQVLDHALMLAYAGGQRQIDGAGIEEAWSDLQQLPSPWNESRPRAEPTPPTGEGIIEFGGLNDEPLEPAFEEPQPTVLLHEIDDHLAALDEEFQPVGTIGPVTVVEGRPSSNPFSESFDEEEVVVDRYAASEADEFFRQPAVHSQEGRILSALLEPFVQAPGGPRLSVIGQKERDEAEGGAPLPMTITAISTADPLARSFDTSSASDAFQAESVAVAEPSRAEPSRAEPTAAQPAAAVEPRAAVSRPARLPIEEKSPLGVGDDDQIVVEDDPRPEPARPRPAPGAARRQEYRQLFSTLRRG